MVDNVRVAEDDADVRVEAIRRSWPALVAGARGRRSWPAPARTDREIHQRYSDIAPLIFRVCNATLFACCSLQPNKDDLLTSAQYSRSPFGSARTYLHSSRFYDTV